MSFREEVEQNYTDAEGMITSVRDPKEKWTSGNHLLITGTYYVLLSYLDRTTEADVENFKKLVKSCEVRPGVYNRNQNRPDAQAHDDYIGIVAASYFLQSDFHREVLDHGENNNWTFDNTDNDIVEINSYFSRFPDFVPFVRAANGKSPSLWEQVLFAIAILVSAFSDKNETSGKILKWLEIQTIRNKYFIIDSAIFFWKKMIFKKYPNGMGDVFGIYFGKDHPFAKYTQGMI